MKQIFLFLTVSYLIACDGSSKCKDCLYDLSKARDAFDYPILGDKSDTDLYIYQLKDILNRQDSFLYVNYGSHYLKQFVEENISLRPLASETFRFSYCPFGQKSLNITFNRNEMIVKLGVSGVLNGIDNDKKLDSLELTKYWFLERYFFCSRQSLSAARVKYYDSMVAKFPELKSVKYYKQLINKRTNYDSLRFKYSTRRIKLSNNQYAALIDSLKKSNFDKLPWRIVSAESVNDGGGYTFEANTKTKFKFFVCETMPIDTLQMTGFCRYLLRFADVDKEIKL